MANVIEGRAAARANVTPEREAEIVALARTLVQSCAITSIAEGEILVGALYEPLEEKWEASLPPRPKGQRLSSGHLEAYRIPNIDTRLGKLYELIDSGRGGELSVEDLDCTKLDFWQKRNLFSAIREDEPENLGLE